MLRSLATSIYTITPLECSERLLITTIGNYNQQRGRRRTLARIPWLPPVQEELPMRDVMLNSRTRDLLESVIAKEQQLALPKSLHTPQDITSRVPEVTPSTRRVGLVVRKIGMVPQWTTNGKRILCTLLEISENNVVSVTSPSSWYKASAVGKRKSFNRSGPMWKVTVGAYNADPSKYTAAYRQKFAKVGIPTKERIGSFLVTEDALPIAGQLLDARHFNVGQYVTATGKTIDWGFQGGMHRWGMRGQPTRRTTKSHRRIGSIGSVGDARIWPGKRMPGHMGYEWRTVSGLEVLRINVDKQVIYVKGSVPGDIGECLLLKDCLQSEKQLKRGPLPTWSPSLQTIVEEGEPSELTTGSASSSPFQFNEILSSNLFRFSNPSVTFTDADAKKNAGRDKTKAKIAKVKK